MIYIGSTYGERLPTDLLDDVLRTGKTVLWINDNILQLAARSGDFALSTAGGRSSSTTRPVAEVRYKGRLLTRWSRQTDGIMRSVVSDPSRARVLAEAVRPDGSTFPWAVRSRNLTYIGEEPFVYTSRDGSLSRVRGPPCSTSSPRERRNAIERFSGWRTSTRAAARGCRRHGLPAARESHVRIRCQPLLPRPTGPRRPTTRAATQPSTPARRGALKYLQRKGGVLVEHGYTHQWDGNPNGITGDDVEFYRVTETKDGRSTSWGLFRATTRSPGRRTESWLQTVRSRPRASHRRRSSSSHITPPPVLVARALRSPPLPFAGSALCTSPAYSAAAPIRFPERLEGQFFPYVVQDRCSPKTSGRSLEAMAFITVATPRGSRARGTLRCRRPATASRGPHFTDFSKLDYLKRTVRGSRRRLHLRRSASRWLWRAEARCPGVSRSAIESDDRARTRDPQLGKLMLYQLSYPPRAAKDSAG